VPRNTPCSHPNCDGGPCKALTVAELTPTDADRVLAERLIDEGWIQTSAKHRHVRRWLPGVPSTNELIAPECRDTPWGRRAMLAIERWVTSSNALHSEHAPWDVTLYGPRGPERKAPPGEVGCYELADHVQPNPLIEERTLTVTEFAAYKSAQRRRGV
jgi:hypothetical protein